MTNDQVRESAISASEEKRGLKYFMFEKQFPGWLYLVIISILSVAFIGWVFYLANKAY